MASESEMQAKFAAIRRWQGLSRLITLVVIIAVAGEFYWFYTSTDAKVRGAFNEPNRVAKAVQQAVPEVTPDVGAMLRRIADEALPVYQKQLGERYAVLRNDLGTKATIRLQKLPEDGAKMLSDKLDVAMKAALKKIEPEVHETFPSMADAKQKDLMIDDFHKMVEEKNKAIASRIDKIRVDEMQRIKFVMDKFALPPDEMASNDEEKGKELVRTMLLLAQAHLDEMDQAAGKPAPTMKVGSTGN